jgi:dipeptidyl aminopeptidase/acylaminoacyl peptidase
MLTGLFANSQYMKEKSIIDADGVNRWVKLATDYSLAITADGNYATYEISNLPTGNSTLIVRSTSGNWCDSFINAKKVCFSNDSRYFLLQKGDTLFRLLLGFNSLEKVAGIQSITKPSKDNPEWIFIKVKNLEGMNLLNCSSGKQINFPQVSTCYFDESGKAIYLKSQSAENGEMRTKLSALLLPSLSERMIFQRSQAEITNLVIYPGGRQIAFSTKEITNKTTEYSLWYFREGWDTVRKIQNNIPDEIGELEFKNDGKFIFFTKTVTNFAVTVGAQVNVWHYLDDRSQQWQEIYRKANEVKYTYAVNIFDSATSPILLTTLNEQLWITNTTGNSIIIAKFLSQEREWLSKRDSLFLVSLVDGSRKLLPFIFAWATYVSPSGRYIVYYDKKKQHYFSYDILKDSCINISNSVKTGQFTNNDEFTKVIDSNNIFAAGGGEVRWVGNKDELYVYDNYDIWVLDATGRARAKSITNGFGVKNGIRFSIVDDNFLIKKGHPKLLLVAFQNDTKFNGFFSKEPLSNTDPEKLVLGPYLFYYTNYLMPVAANMFTLPLKPLKAENKNIWIVKRTGINNAPNYYITKDFVSYRPISNLSPQSNYNWFISELRTWRRPDGIINRGIIYKPENFDSTKKYPVIISYYAQASHRLYDFPQAGFSKSAHINIPWFVSKGYLVLSPDIYFEEGRTNESVFNSVKYAGEFLKSLPYVDSSHIGIAGHSRAGQFTNYIITRTNMFAAALEGAGTSDFFSSALQLLPDGAERRSIIEPMAGATIWENPKSYISNSAIISADKVTTPLLIFHCKNDGSVPFQQALEMFLALQRLDKKVWILDYDNGGHLLTSQIDAEDFTKRITQYFDHFLKNQPAPKWMTQGIPAMLKGKYQGFELDEQSK